MSAPLYCGGDGCSLHDYSTSPAFCEFQWQLTKKSELSAIPQRTGETSIEKLAESIVHAVEKVLTERGIGNSTTDTAYGGNRGGETPSKPYQNKRNGGISI